MENLVLMDPEFYTTLLKTFLNYLVKLVAAIIIFLIGWLIAAAIGKLVAGILRKLKFNQLFEKEVWKEALEKADIKIDVSGFIGSIFKWVLVIVALFVAVDFLQLKAFADFLKGVAFYLPNVIVAILIFVVAVIVADILEKIVRAAVESTRAGYSRLAGVITKWAILGFAILMILYQLQITPALIDAIIQGIVYFLVLSFGLAFGLGGKDVAAEILRDLRGKFRK
jgi:hypothetical protein